MNRTEFEREFSTLCGAYGKRMENEEFLARAYWYKFKSMTAAEFLDLITRAMDKYKFMPNVKGILDLKIKQEYEHPSKNIPVNINAAHREKCLAEIKIALDEGRKRAKEWDQEKAKERGSIKTVAKEISAGGKANQ